MPLCFACLSKDRKMYPLGNNKKIFSQIFHELTIRQSSIPLCWECTAVLRKVKLFKEKVDHAQTVLNYHYLSRDKNPKCLSTLTATKINPADTIIIQDHPDILDSREIKQELIDEYNEMDNESHISFVPENEFDMSVFHTPTNEHVLVIEDTNTQPSIHMNDETYNEDDQAHDLVAEDRQDLVIKQELIDDSFDEYENTLDPSSGSTQDFNIEVKTERMSPELTLAQRNRDAWKRSVLLVYQRLRDHRYVSKFLRKITDDMAPDYSYVVKRPMDLGTIRRNVRNGVIRTTAEFQRDILLMVTNALMYNSSEHIVYDMAKDFFEEAKFQLDLLLEVDSSRVDDSTSLNKTTNSEQQGKLATLNTSIPARRTRRFNTINVTTHADSRQSTDVCTTPAPRNKRLNTTVNVNTTMINAVTPARRSRRLNTINVTSTPIKTSKNITAKNDKNNSSASAAKVITRRRTVNAKVTKKHDKFEVTAKNDKRKESAITAAKVIKRRRTVNAKGYHNQDTVEVTAKNVKRKERATKAAKVITRRRTINATVTKKHALVHNVDKVTAKNGKCKESSITAAKVISRRRTVNAKVTQNQDTVAVTAKNDKRKESAITAAKVITRRRTVDAKDAKVTQNHDTVEDVAKNTGRPGKISKKRTSVGIKGHKAKKIVEEKNNQKAVKVSQRRATVGTKKCFSCHKAEEYVEKDNLLSSKDPAEVHKQRTSICSKIASPIAENDSKTDVTVDSITNMARKIAKRRNTFAAMTESVDKINVDHDHDYGINYGYKLPEQRTTVTAKMSKSLPNALAADKSVDYDHIYARTSQITTNRNSLNVLKMDSDGFAIPTPPAPAKIIVLSGQILKRRSTISSLPKNTTFISTKNQTSSFLNIPRSENSVQNLEAAVTNVSSSDKISENSDPLELCLAKRRRLSVDSNLHRNQRRDEPTNNTTNRITTRSSTPKINGEEKNNNAQPNSTKSIVTENAASTSQTTPRLAVVFDDKVVKRGRGRPKHKKPSNNEIIPEKIRKIDHGLTDKAAITSINTLSTNPAAKLNTPESTQRTIRVRDMKTLLYTPTNNPEAWSIQHNTVGCSLLNASKLSLAPKGSIRPTNSSEEFNMKQNTASTSLLNAAAKLDTTERTPKLSLAPKGSVLVKARLSQPENVCLATAITTESTRDLTRDESNLIKKSLEGAILKMTLDSKNFAPKFRGKPITADGVVKLWCEDNTTLEWLQNTVSRIKIPDLVIRKQSELPKKLKCAILLPGNDDFQVIIRLLKAQNPWALVDSWLFYSVEQRGENTFLVVGVPSTVIPILMAKEQRLSYSLGSVNINFFKDRDVGHFPPINW